jgi:16S rRNA (cytosine967-C5)-methyltransferase
LILDLCASPGNKTVALAADMKESGTLVACDVRPRRVALLRQTLKLASAKTAHVVHVGSQGSLPFRASFDRVLVDAPCSGLGTIRRDPDIRWRRSEAELAGLARDQIALLTRAAAMLKVGGRLIYATCSSEPEENERVVDAFLAAHPDFDVVDLRSDGDLRLRTMLDDRGMLRTLPFVHDLEAFFAAALLRRSG